MAVCQFDRLEEEIIKAKSETLMRKIHAASRMTRAGVPAGAIAKELRLWGDSRSHVLQAAGRLDPDDCAELLDTSIEASFGTRRGLGDGARTLEVLAVKIADRMGSR